MPKPPSSFALWRVSRDWMLEARNGFAVAEAACELQAEAADPSPSAGSARYQRRKRRAAARPADGTGAGPRRHAPISSALSPRWRPGFPAARGWPTRCSPAATCTCSSATIPKAIQYYSDLATRFPGDKNAAAAHWRSGWLSYRLGLYSDAARIFDEQIRLYPGATETVSALYWRGRLYETQDHNPALAAANYRTIVRAYQHFFYAQMSRARLAALGATQPASRRRSWISFSPCRSRIWSTPFPRTARIWPRRGCWPTRA